MAMAKLFTYNSYKAPGTILGLGHVDTKVLLVWRKRCQKEATKETGSQSERWIGIWARRSPNFWWQGILSLQHNLAVDTFQSLGWQWERLDQKKCWNWKYLLSKEHYLVVECKWLKVGSKLLGLEFCWWQFVAGRLDANANSIIRAVIVSNDWNSSFLQFIGTCSPNFGNLSD